MNRLIRKTEEHVYPGRTGRFAAAGAAGSVSPAAVRTFSITWMAIIAFFALAFLFLWNTPVSAAKKNLSGVEVMGSRKQLAGTFNDQGQIVMNVYTKGKGGSSAGYLNSSTLNTLCSGDQQKTIVIPAGSRVELTNVVYLGSNTTIIADGATIVMTSKDKGILSNKPEAVNYRALTNVKIQGGTWEITDKKESCSVMAFSHGSNVTIDGVTILSNYQSHAIELIAMKNTTVQNSTLKVQGRKKKKSVEEALQIDVAAPKTAPVLVQYGKKYVKGQTCKNIKVLNNTIEGSRGVCANYATADGNKYKNKFHENIVIKGNTITGYSAEGCTLYNTLNAVVKNNTITTYSTRKNESYSVGLNITIQGKAAAKKLNKSKVTVSGNTVYGYRQGIQVVTRSSSRYKKAVLKKNKAYASSKSSAIVTSGARSVTSKGNSTNKR